MSKPIRRLLLSIGAMKAGTSWLYENLRYHPDIDCTPVKEVHYLYASHCENYLMNEDARLMTIKYNINRIIDTDSVRKTTEKLEWCKKFISSPVSDEWFSGLYARPQSHIYCAEFSNLNFMLPDEGWHHVKQINEEQKIIITLRNPIDRLWSHVRYHSGLIGKFDDIKNMNKDEFSHFLEEHQFWKLGRYAKVISTVRKHFRDEDIIILIHEDVVRNPQQSLTKLYERLGLCDFKSRAEVLKTVKNASSPLPMTTSFQEVAKPLIDGELSELKSIGFECPKQWLM